MQAFFLILLNISLISKGPIKSSISKCLKLWVSSLSSKIYIAMQNDEGRTVDLYVPRKCSATNKLITSKDHAAIQINIGHVDQNGLYTGEYTPFSICGFLRKQGRSDEAINRLATDAGFLKDTYKF